ncbi:FtsX-like permease family protein [Bowdeniella nasicola]|uniref:FtsX-like permease family protein n=1 Tax=Bowdeniella nasicola TaxID=208480 RepID=UPI0009FB86B5|nr:ABC transporter permease [Bowdeniella nasicola]
MKDVLVAQLRSKPSRLLATTIAVIVAVAFVVVTLSLGGAFTSTMRQAFAEILTNANGQVTCHTNTITSAYLEKNLDANGDTDAPEVKDPCGQVRDKIAEIDGVAAAGLVQNIAVEARKSGEIAHMQGFRLIDPALRWQEIDRGGWPEANNQIAIDAATAEQLGVDVGDEVDAGPIGHQNDSARVTVVGVFKTGRFSFPQAVVPAEKQTWLGSPFDEVARIIVKADSGVSDGQLIERLKDADLLTLEVPDALEFKTVNESVEDELAQFTNGSGIITAVASVFSLIAAVVAGIVITLTFQVLVVQRTRELALLRCIGAEGGQVRRLVLAEALVVGAVASAIGAVLGGGLVLWLFPMLQLRPAVSDTITPMIAGLIVGIILTLICAFGPARRATRVAPLAALRPADLAPVRSKRGIVRLIMGLLITGAGVAALVLGIRRESLLLAMPGGMAIFIGAIILYAFIVPGLLKAISAVWAKRWAPSELAAANASRNPGRTAATASALVVGIGLVVTVVTGRYSMEHSLTSILEDRRPIDLIAQGAEFTDEQLQTIRGLEGVVSAEPVQVAQAYVGTVPTAEQLAALNPGGEGEKPETPAGPEAPEAPEAPQVPEPESPPSTAAGEASQEAMPQTVRVFGMTDEALALARAKVVEPATGEAGVRSHWELSDTDRVTLHFPVPDAAPNADGTIATAARDLTLVEGRGPASGIAWLTADDLATLAKDSSIETKPGAVIVRLADDMTSKQLNALSSDIRAMAEGIAVDGGAFDRVRFMLILDTMMYVILGLLGAAIAIAIIGVSNTLALSVLERRQESGLLRALGFTRGQMRAMLAIEAALIAIVAALGGIALGVFEAWAGVRALSAQLGFDLSLWLPWGWLAGIVGVALAAALIASVLPARTAAKTSPIEAMVND